MAWACYGSKSFVPKQASPEASLAVGFRKSRATQSVGRRDLVGYGVGGEAGA